MNFTDRENERIKDPFDEGYLRINSRNLIDEYSNWFTPMADWNWYATLTFGYEHTTKKSALLAYEKLTREMNIDAIRKNYLRDNRREYFSFIMCMEYQQRGSIHMHMAIAGDVNVDLVEKYWHDNYGMIKIEPINDKRKVVRYICKDVDAHEGPNAGLAIYIASNN